MAQPQWKEVGTVGDVNWPEYDGGPVMVDETGEYPPELEYVETPADDEDFESQSARWTVYRVVLDPGQPWGDREDLESVAESSGQDPDELADAFKSDDPMERAYAYETWAGHFGWHELDSDPLTLTCSEVNKRYPHAKINCYGAIQAALEEEIERMVDQDAATGWSHVDDQLAADLKGEGYDPESIIVEAEFRYEIAVNEDLLVGPHWAEVLGVKANDLWSEVGTAKLDAWLEANGYDYLDKGGRVPTAEGHAYAEHVIDAVTKKLKVPRERVWDAAEALDQWQDEIPGSSSGHTYVWAKKRAAGAEESRRRRAPAPVPGAAHGLEWHRSRDSFVGTVDGQPRFLLDPSADGDWILWATGPDGVQTRKLGRYPTQADAKDAARTKHLSERSRRP